MESNIIDNYSRQRGREFSTSANSQFFFLWYESECKCHWNQHKYQGIHCRTTFNHRSVITQRQTNFKDINLPSLETVYRFHLLWCKRNWWQQYHPILCFSQNRNNFSGGGQTPLLFPYPDWVSLLLLLLVSLSLQAAWHGTYTRLYCTVSPTPRNPDPTPPISRRICIFLHSLVPHRKQKLEEGLCFLKLEFPIHKIQN